MLTIRKVLVAVVAVPLAGAAIGLPLRAQSLTPAGTGLSVAVTAVAGYTTTDLSGRSRSHTGLSPRIEAAFATSPRLAVLGASNRRRVSVDDLAFEVGSIELGVRYTGRPGTAWRPFGEVGMARRHFSYGELIEVTSVKLGPWVGIGGQWRPRGHWSGEAVYNFGALAFDRFRADGVTQELQSVYTRLTGVRVGVRYWITNR